MEKAKVELQTITTQLLLGMALKHKRIRAKAKTKTTRQKLNRKPQLTMPTHNATSLRPQLPIPTHQRSVEGLQQQLLSLTPRPLRRASVLLKAQPQPLLLSRTSRSHRTNSIHNSLDPHRTPMLVQTEAEINLAQDRRVEADLFRRARMTHIDVMTMTTDTREEQVDQENVRQHRAGIGTHGLGMTMQAMAIDDCLRQMYHCHAGRVGRQSVITTTVCQAGMLPLAQHHIVSQAEEAEVQVELAVKRSFATKHALPNLPPMNDLLPQPQDPTDGVEQDHPDSAPLHHQPTPAVHAREETP